MRCKYCPNPADGYNVYFYHDGGIVSHVAVCEQHATTGGDRYDDSGRPDPMFLLVANWSALPSYDEAEQALEEAADDAMAVYERLGYHFPSQDFKANHPEAYREYQALKEVADIRNVWTYLLYRLARNV